MQLILLSFEQQPRIYFVSTHRGKEKVREGAHLCACVQLGVPQVSLSIVSPGRLPETDLGTTAHLFVCNCIRESMCVGRYCT